MPAARAALPTSALFYNIIARYVAHTQPKIDVFNMPGQTAGLGRSNRRMFIFSALVFEEARSLFGSEGKVVAMGIIREAAFYFWSVSAIKNRRNAFEHGKMYTICS